MDRLDSRKEGMYGLDTMVVLSDNYTYRTGAVISWMIRRIGHKVVKVIRSSGQTAVATMKRDSESVL